MDSDEFPPDHVFPGQLVGDTQGCVAAGSKSFRTWRIMADVSRTGSCTVFVILFPVASFITTDISGTLQLYAHPIRTFYAHDGVHSTMPEPEY